MGAEGAATELKPPQGNTEVKTHWIADNHFLKDTP